MTGHFPAVHAHCPIWSADMRKPARRRLHRHRVRDGRRKAGLGPSVAPAGAISRCFWVWRACPSTQPRLFLSRQRKKRRSTRPPQPLSGAACRPPPPGETGRNPVRDSQRPASHARGPSAKAQCRSLPPTMRPARNNLPKAALKTPIRRIQRTRERFRKPRPTNLFRVGNS